MADRSCTPESISGYVHPANTLIGRWQCLCDDPWEHAQTSTDRGSGCGGGNACAFRLHRIHHWARTLQGDLDDRPWSGVYRKPRAMRGFLFPMAQPAKPTGDRHVIVDSLLGTSVTRKVSVVSTFSNNRQKAIRFYRFSQMFLSAARASGIRARVRPWSRSVWSSPHSPGWDPCRCRYRCI